MNTVEFLEIASAIAPDRTAVIFEDKRYTFDDLSNRINRLASALAKLGVEKGDRVALVQVNTNQCIETYFATAKLAAVYVPLNFRARANELSYMINTAEANTVLVGDRYVPIIESFKSEVPSVKNFISLDIKQEGWLNYEELIAGADDDPPYREADENDLTILMYTAGTTGFPKGVMLNHSSFTSYVMSNVSPIDPDIEERNILSVPLYHIAGVQAVMAA
ncbi:MAG: long-chain-fatty-acid--CoA ligase, partial [Dehalococcoidia bacterium]|nr:long-chain-fatty-acid--CoA ligase [Dehalococcoidia bacterium]